MNVTRFLDATRRLNQAARANGLDSAAWGTTPGERSLKRLKEGSAFVKVRIVGRTDHDVYLDMVAGVLAANRRVDVDPLAQVLLDKLEDR